MSIPSPHLRAASRLIAALGCATAVGVSLGLASHVPAGAQTSAPNERLTKAQQEKVFPERKALILKMQDQRLSILEKGKRCTRSAKNHDALRSCLKKERKAYKRLRSEYRDGMRKVYERNDIEAPVGGPGKGKKGRKKAAGA